MSDQDATNCRGPIKPPLVPPGRVKRMISELETGGRFNSERGRLKQLERDVEELKKERLAGDSEAVDRQLQARTTEFEAHLCEQIRATMEEIERNVKDGIDRFQQQVSECESKYNFQTEKYNQLEYWLTEVKMDVKKNQRQITELRTDVDKLNDEVQQLQTALSESKESTVAQTASSGSYGTFQVFRNLLRSSPGNQLENEIANVKQKNKELQQRLQLIDNQVQEQSKRVEKELQATKQTLTSTLLALKGETEGSYTSTDKTPSSVAKEFEHLFNQGCHRLRRALGSISERDGKSLANKLFKESYEECHLAVFQEGFKELFCHNSSLTETKPQKKIYGQVLGMKSLEFVDKKKITLKVMNKVCGTYQDASDAKFHFTEKAVQVAFKMVTMQPPMVIAYPSQFISDSMQHKQETFWDEELAKSGKYELEYFKPVLYSSCEEDIPIKVGHIGNRPISHPPMR